MDATKSRRPPWPPSGAPSSWQPASGPPRVLNAITPLLIEGMGTTVTDYAFGPMLATIFAFVGSLIGAKFITKIGARKCLLIGTVCVTVVLCLIATATNTVLWYVANVITAWCWPSAPTRPPPACWRSTTGPARRRCSAWSSAS